MLADRFSCSLPLKVKAFLWPLVCLVALPGLLAGSFVSAHASSTTHVRKLLLIPSESCSTLGTEVRLHSFLARDAQGRILKIPATLVDVFTGMGNWNNVDRHRVPPFVDTIPANIKQKISLFYTRSLWAGHRGWIVVPRGWGLCSAREGADGNAVLTFEASPGWAAGWMTLDSVPACVSCKWGIVMGLIPWAYSAFGKEIQKDLQEANSPPYKLDPTPHVLSHPNPCTAVLRYQPKNALPIRAVVLLDNQDDHWAGSLYLAVPPKRKELADFILNRYRKINPICASKSSQSK